MSTFLRGKKLITQSPKDNFTKVPNSVLFAKGLNPTEKLILIQLHYYPANWKLAYTRISTEIGITKANTILRWKALIEKGFIIETENHFAINYDLLKGIESIPASTEVSKQYPIGIETIPSVGIESIPSEVSKQYLKGIETIPIEEDTKEEDLKSKTKEQDSLIENQKLSSEQEKSNDYKKTNSSIDVFISNLNEKELNKLQSMSRHKLYDYFINNDSIDTSELYNKIQSLKPIQIAYNNTSIKKNTNTTPENKELITKANDKIQSIDFTDGIQSIEFGNRSQSIEASTAKGGDILAFDQKLLEKVSYVISDLLDYKLIKTDRMIPTVDLLKGLTLNSTEKEIRNHVYEACK